MMVNPTLINLQVNRRSLDNTESVIATVDIFLIFELRRIAL